MTKSRQSLTANSHRQQTVTVTASSEGRQTVTDSDSDRKLTTRRERKQIDDNIIAGCRQKGQATGSMRRAVHVAAGH